MPLIPSNLIPKAPKATIGEIDTCITGLESAVTELQKALLKQIAAALESVQGASGEAAAALRKLAKGKDAEKDAYDNAASVVESIGRTAGTALNTFK